MENVISAEMLQIEGSVPTIGANFEEFKTRLEMSLSQYEMAVTEQNVGDAKKMATSLNKIAKAIREASTEHLRPFKEPINAFEAQVRELIDLVLGKRAVLIEATSQFEEKRKVEAEEAVIDFLATLYEKDGLSAEFQDIDTAPFAALGTLTNGGKLTAKVKEQLLSMVAERVALQHKIELRVASLAGASFDAGLKTALVRQDVEFFLKADDAEYKAKLEQKIGFELNKQKQVEERVRQEAEAEARRKAQEEAQAEIAQQVQSQVSKVTKQASERTQELESKLAEQTKTANAYRTQLSSVQAASHVQPVVKKPLSAGQTVHTVTVVFEVTTSQAVPPEAVERKVRQKFQDSGFVEPKSVTVA